MREGFALKAQKNKNASQNERKFFTQSAKTLVKKRAGFTKKTAPHLFLLQIRTVKQSQNLFG